MGGSGSNKKPTSSKNKMQNPNKRNVFQRIQIDNEPIEREIYVKCPACFCKVFDSGLENELQ